MTALFELEHLSVLAGETVLVDDLSLRLERGERLTILGETGAGKSILAQTIMGMLPAGLTQTGRVRVHGLDLADLDEEKLQTLWGRTLTMLPQEPWHSLDPLMSARQQVAEVYECVRGDRAAESQVNADSDFEAVGLFHDGHKLPGQLSGGMAQRVAFCAATAGGARLLLADEPTKGLDASKRDYIVSLLHAHSFDGGAVLTITHDIEVAQQLAGTIIVMRNGRVVETGTADQLLTSPRTQYTRGLIAASPKLWPTRRRLVAVSGRALITASGIGINRGGHQLFSDMDLQVMPGEIIGVTGDSGSGKSTLGDILLGLLKADTGTVKRVDGVAAHRFQKLYQDPPAAFAPSVPLGDLFADLMALHRLDSAVLPPLLQSLRLNPSLLSRPVDAVSGGELQRLAIARVMLLSPVFLFADEPASRLDPITAKEIIDMLVELAHERDCAVLLVSHDPAVVEKVCDRVIRFSAVDSYPTCSASSGSSLEARNHLMG